MFGEVDVDPVTVVISFFSDSPVIFLHRNSGKIIIAVLSRKPKGSLTEESQTTMISTVFQIIPYGRDFIIIAYSRKSAHNLTVEIHKMKNPTEKCKEPAADTHTNPNLSVPIPKNKF